MINKLIHICKSLIALFLCFLIGVSSFVAPISFSGYQNVSVHAEEGDSSTTSSNPGSETRLNVFGSVGFQNCQIESGSNTQPGSDALQKCVEQIVQFFFVVALFIVAIRIALEALGGLNPFDKSKAIDNTSKLIKDLIIGLVLLGSPALLLTLFNTTTLNINSVLNITGNLSGENNNGGSTNNNGNDSNQDGTDNETPEQNNPQGDPEQASITIDGNQYALNLSDRSTIDEDLLATYDRLSAETFTNFKNGLELVNELNLSDGLSFNDLIGLLSTNTSVNQIPDSSNSLNSLKQTNSQYTGKNVTITEASSSENSSNKKYNVAIDGVENSDKSYKIVNINNGCSGIINSEFNGFQDSSKFPDINCYFVEAQ